MREFGVGTTVGAARHQVWGAVLAGLGVGLGAVATAGLSRFIESQLVGADARLDDLPFGRPGARAGGAGCVRFPAWRAGQVDPIEALSSE